VVVGAERRWGSVPKLRERHIDPQRNFVSQALNSLIDSLVMQTPAETAHGDRRQLRGKAFRIKTGTRCAMPGASALNVTA
jgi:hypothetical protein